LWNYVNDAKNFSGASKGSQEHLIKLLLDPNKAHSFHLPNIINIMFGKVDKDLFFKFIENMFVNGGKNVSTSKDVLSIIEKAYDLDPDFTKQLMIKSESKSVRKAILMLKELSLDEEVLGLRAISTSSYVPFKIFENKYSPSLDALKQLPPMMRLKTLEIFLGYRYLIYTNMFSNIPEDDFNALLFTPSLKYSDRVKVVCDVYQELRYLGVKSTTEIKGECDKCGEFIITLTSGVSRTATGLSNTRLGQTLNRAGCPLCGTYKLKREKQLRVLEDE